MNDSFIQKARLGYYLAWIPMTALMLVLLVVHGKMDWLSASVTSLLMCFVYALLCRSSFYMCKTLPLRRTSLTRLLPIHFTASAAASGIWVALAFALHKPFTQVVDIAWSQVWNLVFVLGLTYYLLSVAYNYVVLGLEQTRLAQRQADTAQTLAKEAQLTALRAQINPHFLFNSLNSISALCTQDAQAARQMCIHLSEFLRSTMRLSELQRVNLGQELDLIRQYLRVEQVRFSDRMHVSEQIDANCLDCSLPALLLQPAIENAIKHGVATIDDEAWIHIQARLHHQWLHIQVSNNHDEKQKPKGTLNDSPHSGRGIKILQDRIHTRYGNLGRIDIKDQNGIYQLDIWLPNECEPSSAGSD